jgi:RNA polymerase sigma-B factor
MADRGTQEGARRRRSTVALLSAYHGSGDRGARAQVIEQNLPLVRHLARRFSRASEPLDDLVQAGTIGLIKAVDGFRADRGRDLGAYAVPTIVGELRRHVRDRRAAWETPGGPARDGAQPSRLDTGSAADAELETDRVDTRRLVREGLLALAPRDRRIVALRFYRDLSQERIAEEVGLSQVQVSRVLASSLTKMRERLEVG